MDDRKKIIGYISTVYYSSKDYTLIDYRKNTPSRGWVNLLMIEGISIKISGVSYELQGGGRKTERVYGN